MAQSDNDSVVTIAFGSCNKTDEPNVFWDDILACNPDIWLWGGDIVYADTEDMDELRALYNEQNSLPAYQELRKAVPISGVWDDHDYGVNDGGAEYPKKKESQQEFLNFMGVAKDDPRRLQEGTYHAFDISSEGGNVKIINLDTRYFRSPLLRNSKLSKKRYQPDNDPTKTMLGEKQWQWLTEELTNSTADSI